MGQGARRSHDEPELEAARARTNRPDVRWRAPRDAAGPCKKFIDDVQAAILLEVRPCKEHKHVEPFNAKEWLAETWKKSLKMMGNCRDNTPPALREHRGCLIETLPEVVVQHYPNVTAPGVSEDDKWLALWNLLKRHQGEAGVSVTKGGRVEVGRGGRMGEVGRGGGEGGREAEGVTVGGRGEGGKQRESQWVEDRGAGQKSRGKWVKG